MLFTGQLTVHPRQEQIPERMSSTKQKKKEKNYCTNHHLKNWHPSMHWMECAKCYTRISWIFHDRYGSHGMLSLQNVSVQLSKIWLMWRGQNGCCVRFHTEQRKLESNYIHCTIYYMHSNINSVTLSTGIESSLTLSPITLLNFFTMKVTKKLVMYRTKGPFAMLACTYEIENYSENEQETYSVASFIPSQVFELVPTM